MDRGVAEARSMFVSSDRTGDPPTLAAGLFAAMLVELAASRASMDTGSRALVWLFRGGRVGA